MHDLEQSYAAVRFDLAKRAAHRAGDRAQLEQRARRRGWPNAAMAARFGIRLAKAGKRNSAADLALIQSIHDITVQLGAECPMPSPAAIDDSSAKAAPGPSSANPGETIVGQSVGKPATPK